MKGKHIVYMVCTRATTAASFSIATSFRAFLRDGTVFCSCNLWENNIYNCLRLKKKKTKVETIEPKQDKTLWMVERKYEPEKKYIFQRKFRTPRRGLQQQF